MIDVYGFDVYHGTNGSRVDITENGQPVAGSRYMPGAPIIYDLPRENEVTVEDMSGRPLGGARVSVYQSTQPAESGPYAKHYDDQPDVQATADGEGRARLGHNPFSADGRFVHSDVGYSNITVIVRVEHEGKVGYGFLEAADFNYEYWKGHTDLGRYGLRVSLN